MIRKYYFIFIFVFFMVSCTALRFINDSHLNANITKLKTVGSYHIEIQVDSEPKKIIYERALNVGRLYYEALEDKELYFSVEDDGTYYYMMYNGKWIRYKAERED